MSNIEQINKNQNTDSNGSLAVSSSELIRNPSMMAQFNALAEVMASGRVTVPAHLQKSHGDCFAIVMQAAQWGMNPFSVAQKTHLVNGVLGYEAQLVNAVIQSSGAINGRFHYEYTGEGATLSCRVGAIIKGESEIVWGEWIASQSITTKNSPLWKTNPKQQIGYLQVKNWARLYCPGAILGVYSDDELQEIPIEKIINPVNENKEPIKTALQEYSQEKFDTNKASWKKLINDGKQTASAIIGKLTLVGTLTDAQIKEIEGFESIEGELA